MSNDWDDDSWQSSYDDEMDEDAVEGEEYSVDWDDEEYDDFLAREFPDSTNRKDWAGGRPLWHLTVWVVLAVFVGGFLLMLFQKAVDERVIASAACKFTRNREAIASGWFG